MDIPIITYSELKRRKKLYGISVMRSLHWRQFCVWKSCNAIIVFRVQLLINCTLVDQSESSNSALHMINFIIIFVLFWANLKILSLPNTCFLWPKISPLLLRCEKVLIPISLRRNKFCSSGRKLLCHSATNFLFYTMSYKMI